MFRLETVFDRPEDCSGLAGLFGRFGDEVDVTIERVLQEIGTVEAIKALSERKSIVEGWTRSRILTTIINSDAWLPEFSTILRHMDDDFSTDDGDESSLIEADGRSLLYLLARYRAGFTVARTLVKMLPPIRAAKSLTDNAVRSSVVRILEEAKSSIDNHGRRKIGQLVANLKKNIRAIKPGDEPALCRRYGDDRSNLARMARSNDQKSPKT